jgi:3-methyladenine DNA glycosylase/8-oxoguanine DNA glycosylase
VNDALALRLVASEELTPTAPFLFDATFHKPDYFPTPDGAWVPGTRRQTVRWRGRPVGVVARNRGTVEAPRVQVDLYARSLPAAGYCASLFAEIRHRFNLDLDLSLFYESVAADPVLGLLIQRWRGLRPGHPNSLYEYLVIGVALQNATVRRSIQMMQALFEAYGRLLSFDGHQFWCFWEPGSLAGVPEGDLRALKLGYRARSLALLDASFTDGQLDEAALRRADPATQRRTLLGLYGVGPATAGYLLTDVLHQWDHLDHISPWEQKIVSHLIFGTDLEAPVPAAALLEHFAQYRPCRALAFHYLWEDLWWRHRAGAAPWLDALIRA